MNKENRTEDELYGQMANYYDDTSKRFEIVVNGERVWSGRTYKKALARRDKFWPNGIVNEILP